jgi:hypothetical protein
MSQASLRNLAGRSFRIQFREEADIARSICSGRIEHLRSGDAAHFSTVEELLSFVGFWLERDAAALRSWRQRRART